MFKFCTEDIFPNYFLLKYTFKIGCSDAEEYLMLFPSYWYINAILKLSVFLILFVRLLLDVFLYFFGLTHELCDYLFE